MANQADTVQKPEEPDDDEMQPLQADYVLFFDAGPGEMRATAVVGGDRQQVTMPMVIVTYSHDDDIRRFAMNFQDSANMCVEVLQSLAYKGSEWAKRVLGAVAMINREMEEEFGGQGGGG